MAFTTVQARLLMPLIGLMRVALDLQTSRALFARIFEYLDLVPAISDAPDAIPCRPGARSASVASSSATWSSATRTRRRTPARPWTGVSFTAEPGQHVAFVGPSGAGKTTVLVSRAAAVRGVGGSRSSSPVRTCARSAQESIIDDVGIVSQETYLFHATIRENLRYAKPDATDEELDEACRAANIHHIIVGFEDGYDTVVGERGYRLSGGEKQRIAIARVLLKDPPVLLLDEATSALDTVSERVVQEALDAAAPERTTLSIAHRLSTVVGADVIHVDRRRPDRRIAAPTPSCSPPAACTPSSPPSRSPPPGSRGSSPPTRPPCRSAGRTSARRPTPMICRRRHSTLPRWCLRPPRPGTVRLPQARASNGRPWCSRCLPGRSTPGFRDCGRPPIAVMAARAEPGTNTAPSTGTSGCHGRAKPGSPDFA